MKNFHVITILTVLLGMLSCNRNKYQYDASGVFEATEIIVSAECAGRIEDLNFVEGDALEKNQYVALIDTTQLFLQKCQLQTASNSISSKKSDISIQVAEFNERIANTEKAKLRLENMLKDSAVTLQEMDNLNTELEVSKKQLAASINSLTTSNNSIDKEVASYAIQVAQIEDKINRCYIKSPIAGTVLNKYVEVKEFASVGKPLFKIANTKEMYLRAYIISEQLNTIKIGQPVAVYTNTIDNIERSYQGRITWISNFAEFTPKTIQTKDERQNLVYSIKVAVANENEQIKIGMYGDIKFLK
jgi:HlyD family secretion protein